MHHRQNYTPEAHPRRFDSRRRRALLALAFICAVIAFWTYVLCFARPAAATPSRCLQATVSMSSLGVVSQ